MERVRYEDNGKVMIKKRWWVGGLLVTLSPIVYHLLLLTAKSCRCSRYATEVELVRLHRNSWDLVT